jgi:dihydropteroate synthase
MHLKLNANTLDLTRPVVMGVLNVTSDSFSDGGKFVKLDDALRQAETMAGDGATFVDIGGESTRPGAAQVSLQQELDRVVPVIERLVTNVDIALSVDTSKPKVMSESIRSGVAMINDVFALRMDGAIEAVSNSDCAVCLMHMQGVPGNMQKAPDYTNVAEEVRAFLEERISACEEAGIDASRIVADPGFGFGKTDIHNIELLANLDVLQTLNRPMLVGLSRKRTLGNLTGRDVDSRMAAGLAAAVLAVERGARIVRTHDVAETVDALKVASALYDAATNGTASGKG